MSDPVLKEQRDSKHESEGAPIHIEGAREFTYEKTSRTKFEISAEEIPDDKNVLAVSVDVEDWYHVPAVTGSSFSEYNDVHEFFDEWDEEYDYLTEPTHRTLDLFDELGITATFFVVADVVDNYPGLVEEIADRGHEIGCHGLHHECAIDPDTKEPRFSREEYKVQIGTAKRKLEKVTGQEVVGFRAPNAYVGGWMLDVLTDLGFAYDSSVAKNSLFNKTDSELFDVETLPYIPKEGALSPGGDRSLVELPWPYWEIGTVKVPTGGGPLIRLFGGSIIKRGVAQSLERGPTSFYFHPIDIARMDFPKVGNVKRRPAYWMFKGETAEKRIRSLLSSVGTERCLPCGATVEHWKQRNRTDHQVVEGLPNVDDILTLLDVAYDGWGDKEFFEWKYNYPGTDRDEHHLYIETDSKPTAFARLYHRELHVSSNHLQAVVRGNAAVHPEYRQMGQYKALHSATEEHCASTNADLVMTFNRKDNYSFRTNSKSEWSYVELPLYLKILSPAAALEEYAASVLANEGALGHLISLLGNRVQFSVNGDAVSLASLADHPSPERRRLTVYLSNNGLHEFVGLAANGTGFKSLAKRGTSLTARNEVSLLPMRASSNEKTNLGDIEVIPRGHDTDDHRNEIHNLYRTVANKNESVIRFRRSRPDVEHMLAHPDLLGTVWVEQDNELAGFAPVFSVKSGSVMEGRVADLCAVDRTAREKLVDGIETLCRENGIDVIAMFAPEQPDTNWAQIRRHVLMWNGLSEDIDQQPRGWDIGFYDVV